MCTRRFLLRGSKEKSDLLIFIFFFFRPQRVPASPEALKHDSLLSRRLKLMRRFTTTCFIIASRSVVHHVATNFRYDFDDHHDSPLFLKRDGRSVDRLNAILYSTYFKRDFMTFPFHSIQINTTPLLGRVYAFGSIFISSISLFWNVSRDSSFISIFFRIFRVTCYTSGN